MRVRKVTPAGTISTVAGGGNPGFSGDGGAATAASLNLYQPAGLALDTAGNLYIADAWNNRIRKVNVAGTITTVAGNGTGGLSGDGGPATSAGLSWPTWVAFDSAGQLLIADSQSHRIRRADALGIINTVAGSSQGYSGDNGPATNQPTERPRCRCRRQRWQLVHCRHKQLLHSRGQYCGYD